VGRDGTPEEEEKRMKLSVLLTPLVAVTAAGWLGAEGYYLATGNCPLSACTSQEGAVAAQPVTVGTPAATGGDACCPVTPAAAIPIAVAPATAPSDGACCPSLAGTSTTTAEGAVAPSAPTAATATGAVAPSAPTAATATGAVAPSAPTAATATGAVAPKAPAASDGCCPMTPNTPAAAIPAAATAPTAKADGACASKPADACATKPADGCMPGDACGPNEVAKKDCAPGEACESTKATKATGLETPSAAMECEPLDCDDEGACCSGADIAPVDTQAPVAPRE
jgi:hypothetical protein